VKICFFHLMPYRKKRLQRIAAPTLIHWGTDDRVNPAVYGEEFPRRIRVESGAEGRTLADGPFSAAG
jgi:pimeloyl-ACP methyl ester carboxylesterase